MNTDGQGLAQVTYQEWQRLSDDRSVWTYRGGARGGPMFLAYVIGSETGGSSALPPPSLKSRDTLLMYGRRDGWVCHLCCDSVDQAARGRNQPSIDHLIPRVSGGSDYPSNLHIAHINCNKSRRARSLSTHAVCRESLMPSGVSLHALAHDGKGDRREEIGERKGRGVRAEAFHHVVQEVTRDPATIVAPSPVTTPDAMMSLAAIEHLDFEAEMPCDGSWDGELCQNAAFGVVVALCRGCRQGGRSFICRRCWSECQAVGWICPSCGRHCESRFILLVVTFR